MSYHGIIMRDGVLYCKGCQRSLDRDRDVPFHVACKDNDAWNQFAKQLASNEFIECVLHITGTVDFARCKLCHYKIEYSLTNIKQHITSDLHKDQKLRWFKKNNAVVPADGRLWCKICEISLDDNINDVVMHVRKDFTHRLKLEEIEKLTHDEGIQIKSFLSNPNEKNAYCERCDAKFLCNLIRIQCHIHSECHSLRIL